MQSYEFLAGCYDALTTDVGYTRWADYIERQFARAKRPIHTVLDLACGTGSLTRELALRGYEMIGVDLSAEMLGQAAEKCRDLPGEAPLFLQQSMDRLDLYGTIDACVCCLDSINYVTSPKLLARAFARVALFLLPGGLFLFDVNTPEKFAAMDGATFIDENKDCYCVWRADYIPRAHICSYGMDIFRRTENGLWTRGEELHEEYVYEMDTLEEMLRAAGFCAIKRHGDKKLRAPKAGEERVFFTAWKR